MLLISYDTVSVSSPGVSPAVLEHRKQIDDLKKFKNDFRVSVASGGDKNG